jgi:hypothetical protein
MTDSQTAGQTDTDDVACGTWSPLKNRLFALLLLVNLFATLAVFMNGLGAAWV